MLQIQNIEGIQRRYSQKNMLLGYYHHVLQNSLVTVPTEVVSNAFVLDFETRLKEAVVFEQNLREDAKKQILELLVSTYDKLSPQDLVPQLKALGFNVPAKVRKGDVVTEEDKIYEFVVDMQARIAKSISEGGLTNIMVKESLSFKTGLNFEALKDINLSSIQTVVSKAQQFYTQFRAESKGDNLALRLAEATESNGLLKAVKALYLTFNSPEGMNVACRESHVLESFFTQTLGQSFVTVESEIPGKCYRYSNIAINELSFAEAISGFMFCLNASMGSQSQAEGQVQMPLSKIAEQLITGVGTILPFTPSEAGTVDINNLDSHTAQIYLIHVLRRLMRDDFGEYESRIQSQIKANSYFKFDGSSAHFFNDLKVLSVSYEAFRDVAAYYRGMFNSDSLLFADSFQMHHHRRSQIRDFVEERIKQLSSVVLGVESDRFYRTAQHVIEQRSSVLLDYPILPTVHVPDDQVARLPRYTMANDHLAFLSVATSGLISGSWSDVYEASRLGVARAVLSSASRVEPLFYVTRTLDGDILTSRAIKNKFRFFGLNSLLTIAKRRDDVSEILMKHAQIKYLLSAEDLARQASIPLDMAEIIYHGEKNYAGYFADLGESNDIFYILEPNVFRIVDVLLAPDDALEVVPFVAKFPAILTEVSGFTAEAEIKTHEREKPKGKKGGKKKPKNDLDPTDDDVDPIDPTADPIIDPVE